MILLAFLLPFSIYLLLLGSVNRRSHPVVVSGTWDFVGVLFAASGFLLVIGPAVLSSGSEAWRMFWLFGARAGVPSIEESASRFWAFLAVVYFAVVVGGSVYLLRQRRSQTAIYNVSGEVFEHCLVQVFRSLGLSPLRSGNLFVFGAGGPFASSRRTAAAIQAPHHLVTSGGETGTEDPEVPDSDFVIDAAVLEVDVFQPMRHVTLRWEPPTSLLRHEVETELARTLSRTASPANPVGDWMVLLALGMIGFNLLLTFGLTASSFLRR